MAIVLFWICSGILAYVYVGYPLIVRIWASYAGRPVRRNHLRPTVTVIVSVYNEEKSIRSKIDNILALEYLPDLLDVIVVSDASVDLTDDIVRMRGDQRQAAQVRADVEGHRFVRCLRRGRVGMVEG